MTVILAFTQGKCAYLLADSATTDDDGTLIDIRDKVLRVDRLRTAIIWTGQQWGDRDGVTREAARGSLKGVLREIGSPIEGIRSQGQLLSALASSIAHMHQRNLTALGPGASEAKTRVRVVVALWNEGKSEPGIYMADSAMRDAAGELPFVRLQHFATTDGGEIADLLQVALGRTADLSDPKSFDPVRDGLAVLNQQRLSRCDVEGQEMPYFASGGRATGKPAISMAVLSVPSGSGRM